MAAEDTSGTQRVSLSVDLLRSEIRIANLESENRVKDFVSKELDTVRREQERLSRGEFNQAQTSAISKIVDESFLSRAKAGFTLRERRIALAGLAIAGSSMAASIAMTMHYLVP